MELVKARPIFSLITNPARSPEQAIKELLSSTGITINGSQPYDIQVHNPEFYKRVLSEGSLGFGESYMDGWWDTNALDELVTRLLSVGLDVNSVVTPKLVWQVAKSRLKNMQDRVLAQRVAKEHYDLDNRFYSLMLDKYMQYTCAYYKDTTDLDQAQVNKLKQICEKLELTPGQKVLELGCGFGGFAKYAAEHYGVEVEGYNISKEQVAWARNWTKDLPVKIHLKDYREAVGTFDKVVSVGLCEHVGYKNYRTLLKVAKRSLRKGGLVLLHHIGGNVTRYTTDPWLEKYIFPGSVMPSPSQISRAAEGLFVLEDWHNFGVDYDKTLMAWYENFNRNWEQIKSERFNDRFYRMWKYYLLMCAGSFRARKNQNWELVFSNGYYAGGYHCRRM